MVVIEKNEIFELEILNQVSHSSELTNRIVAKKLGCSVKLAHSLLGGMVKRGFLHVKKLHSRRWDYFLTPEGISEKARLTYEFLDFSYHFYREARKRSSQVCREIAASGLRRVAFIGTGDLAEIAYLGVKEWKLELCGVYDEKGEGEFLGYKVELLSKLKTCKASAVLVCLYDKERPMSGIYKLPDGFAVENKLRWIFKNEQGEGQSG